MHLPQTGSFFFLLFFFLEVVIFHKSSPFNPHMATRCQCSFQKVHTHTPVFVKDVVIGVASIVVVVLNLYSLDLVGHHHGVLFTDLGGSLGLVIVGAVVLVGVPVDAAEQVSAAAVEACKAHSFAAHEAPVLLGFGGVTFAVFTAGRSYRSWARSSRLVYNRF